MAFDPWTQPRAGAELYAPAGANTDAAAFMAKVYRWMAIGLGLTGLIAMGVASSRAAIQVIFGTPFLALGLMLVAFAMAAFLPAVARRASFATVALMFVAYASIMGVVLSSIFLRYTGESIASTFFITGGAFGAMSVYGTVTRRDLTSWGSFLFMGLIGVVLAGFVNIFVRSDALAFVLSCAGVVVFTGLAAYDTQKLRQLARVGDDRIAITGALMLYLDFVNLFLSLLRLFGRRR